MFLDSPLRIRLPALPGRGFDASLGVRCGVTPQRKVTSPGDVTSAALIPASIGAFEDVDLLVGEAITAYIFGGPVHSLLRRPHRRTDVILMTLLIGSRIGRS